MCQLEGAFFSAIESVSIPRKDRQVVGPLYIGIFSYYFNFRMRTTYAKIEIIEILFTIDVLIECTTLTVYTCTKIRMVEIFLYEGFRESKNTRSTFSIATGKPRHWHS